MEVPVQSTPSESLSIDFGALRQQASDLMDKAEAERAAAPSPTPSEPPATAGAGQAAEPTEPVEQPKTAFEIPDDALVKVIVDGEEVLVPGKEAKAGFSRTQKFTKSMQQLAAERKALEEQRTQTDSLRQERDQLVNLVNNRQALVAYLRATEPALFAAPAVAPQQQFDPNEIATVGQAQTIAQQQAATLEQRLQALQQSVTNEIQQATTRLQHQEQVAKHATAINATLTDIFSHNPVLKAIPNVEDVIRFEVAKMNPQTEADALQAFRDVAQGMAEELGKHYTATKKVQAAAAAKQKLETKTIEPAGGSAPQIQPTNFKNADGTVNWNAVTQMARDYLNN